MSDARPTALPSLTVAGSGYLARLAQRARGEDERLQRRRPALFEPVAPWRGDEVSETVAEPAVFAARRARPAGNRPGADPDAFGALDDATSALASPARPQEAARRAMAAAHPGQPPTARPAPTVPLDARMRRAMPQCAVAAASAPAGPGLIAAVGPAGPASETRASGAAVPTVQPLRAGVGGLAQDDGAAPLLRPPGAAATSALRRRTALRMAAPAPVAGRPEPAPQRAPEPVQVTIGRVEVRTVTAPEPALPRHRTATPRLSLEQYLHERQRGAR